MQSKQCAIWVSAAVVAMAAVQSQAATVYTDQATFLANAGGGLSVEGFEGHAIQPANTFQLTSLSFSDFDIASGGSGVMGVNTGAGLDGPYPSPLFDGNWLHFEGSAPEATFTFTFDTAIYAFGIGIADPVDNAGGTLSWSFNAATPDSGTIASDEANGAQLFFGVVSTEAFTELTLTHNPAAFDGMGLDNLYYGTPVVPVPAGLGLGLLGFALVGVKRRFRKTETTRH